jgi:acyl-CoA thioesterase FadM
MARAHIPESALELALQVRSYEVGRDGCLRPANVLRYFEYLATEDSSRLGFDHTWYERHGSAWVVREMRLLLGTLLGIGGRLRMATWVSGYSRVQAHREYVLWREADSRLVARAQGRWAYVDRVTGRPQRVPEELSARIAARGQAMPLWELPEVSLQAQTSPLTVVARWYEADSQQHINNAVYMDWLEEQMLRTPADLIYHPGGAAQLRRVDLEYLRPGLPGEQIHIQFSTERLSERALAGVCQMKAGDERAPVLRARTLYLVIPPGLRPLASQGRA